MFDLGSRCSRRSFLGAGGAGLALAAFSPSGKVHAETAEVEKANEALVMKLCKDISAVDPTKLAPLLADDFVFQLFDGTPLVEGKEAFLEFVTTFFAPFERAEFIVHRSFVIGNLVINERTDHFFAKEGGKDQTFRASGFSLVKNGKIQEWKDYAIPS